MDIVTLMDTACVILGCVATAWILTETGNLPVHWRVVFQSAIVAAILTGVGLRSLGHYDEGRIARLPVAPLSLLAVCTIAIFTVFGLSHSNWMSDARLWSWTAAAITASVGLLVASRLVLGRCLSRLAAAGRFDQRIAVFGAGAVARRVRKHLESGTGNITFAGAFDDRAANDPRNGGHTPDGRLADLVYAARAGHIDQIVIALPPSAEQRVAQVARQLEHLPVSLHIVTHIASDILPGTATHKVSSLGPVGVIDVKRKALADWAPIVKQAEDYILGAVLLVVVAPLLLAIAIAIKLDSPGPVLFIQRRRGLNHRVINVLKFRTMSVLEDGAEVRQAGVGDPRVTRVGRFLRRSSLDELPQLVNVLKGEMSLVGPRPHALVHDERFSEILEEYANRHQVKPGMTGLAQVRGHRGETSTTAKIRDRVEADIEYIKTWSLKLDLAIMAGTFKAVLKPQNAH